MQRCDCVLQCTAANYTDYWNTAPYKFAAVRKRQLPDLLRSVHDVREPAVDVSDLGADAGAVGQEEHRDDVLGPGVRSHVGTVVRAGRPTYHPPMGYVLVVDDDPTVRDVVAGALREDGYAVRTAGDGLGAIAAVDAEAPDVVVLDLRLPDVDGVPASA